jgi:GAF domain-containing protein
MTLLLIGICAGLGALVALLATLLVVRSRAERSSDAHVAEVVERLNSRMDELGQELAGALERAEDEGRRSRIFGELAGSIDLDEVLARTLEAAGALGGADAALVMLPDGQGGKPLVATLGLSVEEAERHAITGPPDGRLARSISMSYTYPDLDREPEVPRPPDGIIHGGLAVPLSGETGTLGYLTVVTRSRDHAYAEADVRELEALALRAGPAIENARRFREARQLADLDALTGLHNRRFFHETLARECARAHRYERKLSLIVFDLDDFKEINDRIGHLAGDAVLAEAAKRVRDAVPQRRRRVPSRRQRVRGHPAGGFAQGGGPAVSPDPAQRLRAAGRPGREALSVRGRRRAPSGRRRRDVLPAGRRRALPRQGRRQGPCGRRQLGRARIRVSSLPPWTTAGRRCS